MGGDELEVFEVFGGEGGHGDASFGEVDAFGFAEPLAGGPGEGDINAEMGSGDGADDAADFAVIEPDGLAGPGARELGGEVDTFAGGSVASVWG